ncbi:MAG: signal peptidase I [Clostridium sp.]|nr:signal peptidase I [Clostridium sp.]
MEKKRRISLQDVLGAVLCILFIPIIILNVILIVSNYMHPGEMPEAFGVKPAVVLSGSMEPEIMTGDLIFLHRADTADLKEGDVICYLLSGKAVTHRIIKVTQDSGGQERYITRGDANNVEDRQPVSPDQVQGIWKGGRIGGLGNLFIHMQTPGGMLLFVLCPLMIFIIWELWLRRRADRAEKLRNVQQREKLEAELEAMRRQLEGQASPGGEPAGKYRSDE